jgi:type I restriction enzyme S subunit
MRVKVVPSAWLERDGRRLDCGPYMSGALEAKVLIDSLRARKDPLQLVTQGGMSGIFHAGRIRRTWVESPAHGRPFLSSTDILQCDLPSLPYISNRAVAENPRLPIATGWTLITRSGTIGRMAYSRPDIDGYACSEHVLRVVPEPSRIPPGYLYAYLSSKFGVPLVVGGTYGAIIQHIEPEHIADLPVPRLGSSIESQAGSLVDHAANMRVRAANLLHKAQDLLVERLSIPAPRPKFFYRAPQVVDTLSSSFSRRGDAYYYIALNRDAREAWDVATSDAVALGIVADVFIPGIFKRQYADDPAYGVPYITGADMFQIEPKTNQFLLTRVVDDVGLRLRRGMIVVQEAGQLGGLIGRSVLVGEHLDGYACTNNMVRITAKDPADTGYLFAVLSSIYGVRLVSREAAGSSIPHLEAGRVRAITIPWPAKRIREEVGVLVVQAQRLRDEAISADREARALVENAIETGAN